MSVSVTVITDLGVLGKVAALAVTAPTVDVYSSRVGAIRTAVAIAFRTKFTLRSVSAAIRTLLPVLFCYRSVAVAIGTIAVYVSASVTLIAVVIFLNVPSAVAVVAGLVSDRVVVSAVVHVFDKTSGEERHNESDS